MSSFEQTLSLLAMGFVVRLVTIIVADCNKDSVTEMRIAQVVRDDAWCPRFMTFVVLTFDRSRSYKTFSAD